MIRLRPIESDAPAIFGAFISVLGGLFAFAFLGAFAIFVPLLFFPPVNSVGTALVEIAVATAALYAVSNAFRLLSKRRPGYHEDDSSPLPARRLTQPVLLAISFVLALVLIAYPGWWHHRLASREYAHSKSCYALLEAADRRPDVQAKFAPGYLQYDAGLYLGTAEMNGAMLGIAGADADRDLKAAAAASSAASAHDPSGRAALVERVTQCLNDDWPAHGEILNP